MEQRDFGSTGLRVSVVGLGAAQVGAARVSDADAERLLNQTLDAGVTLLDTACCYGSSEERIGRYLRHRRGEFVLSSKTGHGIEGHADWTAGAVRAGVERSLRRLQTDRIDVMHLHTCSQEVLNRGEVIDELAALQAEGAIGVVAHSGENSELLWAVESGRFGSVETSVNIADQWSLHNALPAAVERGLGVIGKRTIANAAWKYTQRPVGVYGEEYWERLGELSYQVEMDPLEFAVRFAVYAPGVSSSIIGTADVSHLLSNLQQAARGPLPADVLAHVEQRWQQVGGQFRGLA